ncbi:MAG: chemotaxis protein MotB [bacterium]|jgi:chemotaxis protein MotB
MTAAKRCGDYALLSKSSRTLIFLALLSMSCVGRGKYTEALDANAGLTSERDALTSEVTQLSDQSERLQTELDATNAVLEQTNRRLADAIAQTGALEGDVARMEAALKVAEQREQAADAALVEYRELVARFQDMIDAGTLSVRVIDGRMVVELATDILFGAGSATLSTDGTEALRGVSTVLAAIPDREFQVAGHTDNVPISTARFPSNWDLGASRAIAVVDVLTGAGLDGGRVSAASFAETKPRDTNRTPEGRKNNRRIEITVVPDLSELPGYRELEALASGE